MTQYITRLYYSYKPQFWSLVVSMQNITLHFIDSILCHIDISLALQISVTAAPWISYPHPHLNLPSQVQKDLCQQNSSNNLSRPSRVLETYTHEREQMFPYQKEISRAWNSSVR